MTLDHSQPLAVFDPKALATCGIQPFATEDSQWSAASGCLNIERGSRDRLIVYFKIDPMLASRAGARQELTIEYEDVGSGSWFIEYITQVEPNGHITWANSERVVLTNSGQTKSARFTLSNSDFTGSANGADFRLTIVDSVIDHFALQHVALEVKATDSKFAGGHFLAPSLNTHLRFKRSDPVFVSIIIPVFNRLEYTLDCLRALCEFTPLGFELIVVNNGSTDHTQDRLSQISGLTLINNPNNLGFARACNQGARAAHGKHLVFLNNDTLPQPGWLGALTNLAERRANPGVIGSRLIYPHNGRIQSAGVGLGNYLLPVEEYRGASSNDPIVSVDRQVMAVSGAAMLITQECFTALTGFDEQFLNGYEDIDLCLRARDLGRQNWFCAHSDVLHYQSATEGRFDLEKDRANVSLFRERWHAKLSNEDDQSAQRPIGVSDLPLFIAAGADEMQSQTGLKSNVDVRCLQTEHSPGHCAYGPYLRLSESMALTVTFEAIFTELKKSDAQLITIDVYDSVSDAVLAEAALHANDDGPVNTTLAFAGTANQILEFRVYWHGQCDLVLAGLTLQHDKNESTDEPQRSAKPTVIREVTDPDRSLVKRLFNEVFKTSMSDALWDWKYSNGNGVAMIAERDGIAIGHYGGVFRSVRYDGDSLRALQCVDVMVSPAARESLARKGVFYQLAVSFRACYVGNSRTALLTYGFPNQRHFDIGVLLGIQSSVGKIVEPYWTADPSSPLPEENFDPSNTKHWSLVNDLDQDLASELKGYYVGERNGDYIVHRYLNNPSFRYQIQLVYDISHHHCLGVLVYRVEGSSLLIMDLVARLDNLSVLILQARRHASALRANHVTMWITENQVRLLGDEPDSIHDPKVNVGTLLCTDGPSVSALSNKWWLTTGDTDFK